MWEDAVSWIAFFAAIILIKVFKLDKTVGDAIFGKDD